MSPTAECTWRGRTNDSCDERPVSVRAGNALCLRHRNAYDFDEYATRILADQPED